MDPPSTPRTLAMVSPRAPPSMCAVVFPPAVFLVDTTGDGPGSQGMADSLQICAPHGEWIESALLCLVLFLSVGPSTFQAGSFWHLPLPIFLPPFHGALVPTVLHVQCGL